MNRQSSHHAPRDEKRDHQQSLIQSRPSRGRHLYHCRFHHVECDGYFRQHTAFTLLELMLALGLTTVILLAVSMMIDLHLRSFDSRREFLEESQLARETLNIIANDIRGVVQDYEQDLSTLDQLVAQSAEGAIAALGEGEGELGSGDSGLELDTSELLAGDESVNTMDLAATVSFPTTLGIYGNQYELQIDVSRLPRFDEYQAMLAADRSQGVIDVPSDIKTVTYHVIDPQSAPTAVDIETLSSDISTSTDPEVVGRGLVRRQLDRAVAQHAANNGLLTTSQSAGEVIAPEVVSLEFQYFDGVEWRVEWDTEAEEGLPLAIQIILVMQSQRWQNLNAAPGEPAFDEFDTSNLNYYRLLVPVATGEATESDTASLEAAGI